MKRLSAALTALTLSLIGTNTLASEASQDGTASRTTVTAPLAVALPSPATLRDDICWVAPEWLED